MACFRRSGMQWGVGETASKQKKRKERETEGQKRDKLNRNDGKERRKLRAGRASLASITFLRRSFLHGMPAIPTNQRPIKILK